MDLFEFLEENGIDYKTSGKNISTGWIGVQCPFCDDHSDHLGIRINDLRCSCWRCGRHSFTQLMSILTDLSNKELRKVKKFLAGENVLLNPPIKGEKPTPPRVTTLPPESTKHFPKIHKEYLRRRNFHPNLTIRKYDLFAVNNITKYKFRIIVPFYHNRLLVSFTTRAIFDEMEPKYLNPDLGEVGMSPKISTYNIDNIIPGKDVLITEGVTDVWRWGDGAVGLNGIEYTLAQLLLVVKKKPRKVFVMFDKGRAAQYRAEEVAKILYPFVSSVELIEPEMHEDLGDFTPNQVHEVKRMLGFNK